MMDVAADLTTLFPPGVAVGLAQEGDGECSLLPGELCHVANAVAARRREFGQGRAAARRALAALGHPPCTLPKGPGRDVAWPTGVVGSITHTDGLCAAVAAASRDVRAIGVDAEPAGSVTPDLWGSLFTSTERRQLRGQSSAMIRATVLFSAKESAFKAQFPLTGLFVEFEEAEVDCSWTDQRLTVRGPFGTLAGQFMLLNGVVITGAWRAEGSPQ